MRTQLEHGQPSAYHRYQKYSELQKAPAGHIRSRYRAERGRTAFGSGALERAKHRATRVPWPRTLATACGSQAAIARSDQQNLYAETSSPGESVPPLVLLRSTWAMPLP